MFRIISCSEYARNLLSRSDAGSVHSIYNRTINLLFDGRLLALQSRGSPLSPLSLELDCSGDGFSALRISPGLEVLRGPEGLSVGGRVFSLSSVTVWDSSLSDRSNPPWLPASSFLRDCLAGLMPTGGFADLVLPGGSLWRASPSALAAGKYLAACSAAVRTEAWTEAARELSRLLGLGEGLTPSGDDFLCGVLAASYGFPSPSAQSLRRALELQLLPRLRETNDISAAFLRCTLEGHFSQAVIALLQGESRGEIIRRFGEIGHSSGADTLSGILYFAENFMTQKEGI